MDEHYLHRSALVTGASRGLGRALARALAAEGWHLILDARDATELEHTRRVLAPLTSIIAIAGDVTDPTHRETLARAASDGGGLDAVINNAGTLGASPLPSLLTYPLGMLDAVYRTNVIAPLGVLQAVRPFLHPGASVINVTSDAAVTAYDGWGGYGSSKAALEQLSAVLAIENPAWRIYWVDPGDMRTQMHQDAYPGHDISDRPLPEESIAGLLALLTGNLPSGRYVARSVPQEVSS
jgi:NAD(P)-dependent dehydrogenase (short-subunit alcohol dehydrogenase family)